MEFDVSEHASIMHDAEIIALRVEENALTLELKTYDGQTRVLTLSDVLDLRVVGFWLQNVVDTVELAKVNAHGITDVYREIGSVSGKGVSAHRKQVIEDRLVLGDLIFFYLVPSNGCSVLALCNAVKIS